MGSTTNIFIKNDVRQDVKLIPHIGITATVILSSSGLKSQGRMNSGSMFQTAAHCAHLTVHYFSSRALAQTGPQVIGVTSAFVKLGLLPDYVQLDAMSLSMEFCDMASVTRAPSYHRTLTVITPWHPFIPPVLLPLLLIRILLMHVMPRHCLTSIPIKRRNMLNCVTSFVCCLTPFMISLFMSTSNCTHP